MRGFPFVLGTDIVLISRFDPVASLSRIQRLARRFLHPAELSYLETRYPNHHTLLRATNPTSLSLKHNASKAKDWSDTAKSAHHHSRSDELLQSNTDAQKLKSWLAGRWAAKEAARKAWGADIIGYKDVRVEVNKALPSSSSASVSIVCEPFLDSLEKVAHGSPGGDQLCDSVKAETQPMQEGALSISHDGDYVVATVVAEPLKEELRNIFILRSEKAIKATTSSLR